MEFEKRLKEVIRKNYYNNYGSDNYDELRFGILLPENKKPLKKRIKIFIKRQLRFRLETQIDNLILELKPHVQGLEILWNNLQRDDRTLLLHLLAYRLLGFRKIKLPRNNKSYWEAIGTANTAKIEDEKYDPHFMHFILNKFNLNKIGIDAELFFSSVGIAIDFIIEQYAYKLNGSTLIQANQGDIILDIGGCWGDTAIYFAGKVAPTGKVYSFEFIPENIKLFNINIALNPHLSSIVELIPFPVYNKSDVKVYYKDFGPGSKVDFSPFEEYSGVSRTLCIDDFVESKEINKLDFIKMDIEGSEFNALQGAQRTIRKFKPKLAIAIYHSIEDMYLIPNWILNLNLGYELYLGHYTIHSEETVIFAKCKNSND